MLGNRVYSKFRVSPFSLSYEGTREAKPNFLASIRVETVFLTAIKRLFLIGILLFHCRSHYKGRSHITVVSHWISYSYILLVKNMTGNYCVRTLWKRKEIKAV